MNNVGNYPSLYFFPEPKDDPIQKYREDPTPANADALGKYLDKHIADGGDLAILDDSLEHLTSIPAGATRNLVKTILSALNTAGKNIETIKFLQWIETIDPTDSAGLIGLFGNQVNLENTGLEEVFFLIKHGHAEAIHYFDQFIDLGNFRNILDVLGQFVPFKERPPLLSYICDRYLDRPAKIVELLTLVESGFGMPQHLHFIHEFAQKCDPKGLGATDLHYLFGHNPKAVEQYLVQLINEGGDPNILRAFLVLLSPISDPNAPALLRSVLSALNAAGNPIDFTLALEVIEAKDPADSIGLIGEFVNKVSLEGKGMSECIFYLKHGHTGAAEAVEKMIDAADFSQILTILARLDPLSGVETLLAKAYEKLLSFPKTPEYYEDILCRSQSSVTPQERDYLEREIDQLPTLRRAREYYQSLRQDLDLGKLKQIDLTVGGETIKAYSLLQNAGPPSTRVVVHTLPSGATFESTVIEKPGPEYRMLVHAINVFVSKGSIEDTVAEKIAKGVMCVSLIDNQTNYHYRQNQFPALVLDIDPRNIVATSREDAYSPYSLNDPDTKPYYAFRQRAQLLTGRVDEIYRKFNNGSPVDELTKYGRLKSLDKPRQVQEAEVLNKISPIISTTDDRAYYRNRGTTQFKLAAMLDYYLKNPRTTEQAKIEFKELFGYEGTDIVGELQKYLDLFKHGRVLSGKSNIHPIESPNALLATTPYQNPFYDNDYGANYYNEINVILSPQSQGQPPLRAKAILISGAGLAKNPQNFEAVLKNARDKGIPILIK